MKTRTRVILSVVVILFWAVAGMVFTTAQGPIQGGAAIGQLNGGNAEYVAARAAATTSVIPATIAGVAILALIVLWVAPLVRACRALLSDQV